MEGVPAVEVTMERNLTSGVHPLWYSIAKRGNSSVSDAPGNQVIAVGEARPSVLLQVYKENTVTAGDSEATFYVRMSGMYLGNYSMSVGVDGPATESLTFTGNDYSWTKSTGVQISGAPNAGDPPVSGLVFKRQDLKTSLPSSVTWVPSNSLIKGSGLQSISVSIDFGREDIFELGQKTPYYKAPNYPVEVSTELEFIETNTITREYGASDFTENTTSDVTTSKPLGFVIGDIGVFVGSGNRLTGTSTTGGDAGGGNATITFSYQTFNELAAKSASTKHYNKENASA